MNPTTENKIDESRWTSLSAFRAAPEKVETNVITGCSIVTVGEALGHGVHLDKDFVKEVYRQGDAMRIGLKSRFGHPGMCSESLGTYLGRFRNFRLVDGGERLLADLHFAESARKSPHGDLPEYVKQLAKDDPKAFGTSIVFIDGERYRRDKDGNKIYQENWSEYDAFELTGEVFASCQKLLDCDFVDEPAANPDGLFASASVAGELNQFLAEHPEVETFLENNEKVVDYIQKYGVNIKQYLKAKHMKTEQKTPDKTEEKPDESLGKGQETETKTQEKAQESTPPAENTDLGKGNEKPEGSQKPADVQNDMSLSEYREIVNFCGVEIADEILNAKGTKADAVEKYCTKLKAENKELSEENTKLKAELEENGGSFTPEETSTKELTGIAKATAALKSKSTK